jgi:flagellum-specific peptidoglycan hydrolase FlgJ
MPSPDQLRTLETRIAPAAIAAEALTGVPAELACAQCVLESGWLTKMPEASNNCFGIKGTAQAGVLVQTREWFTALELWTFLLRGGKRAAQLDPAAALAGQNGRRKFIVQDYFAKFERLCDAFLAHSNLLTLNAHYAGAVKAYQVDHDLAALVRAIAPVYATDPHYAEALGEIAQSAEVTSICARLRGATTGY